jgi:hypothetical protein
MKRILLGLGVVILAAWYGFALAGTESNLSGKITKMDGEMWTVEMADGKTKSAHIDPATTKKEGELKVGAMVTADVASNGHANWIKAAASEPAKK